MPMLNVKTPGNTGAFNQFFVAMSSIKLIDFADITATLMYLPEGDPLSLNLQE